MDLAEGMEAATTDRMAGAIMEVAMVVDSMAECLVAGMVEVIMEGVMGEGIMEENITIMAAGIIMGFTDITHIITHSPTMDITHTTITHTPIMMDTIQPHRRMEPQTRITPAVI